MQIFAIVVSLAITVAAVIITARAVKHMLGILRMGQPASRSDRPGARALTMLKETFGHTRMLQWHWIGALHWFVYMAFLVLSAAVLTGYFQLFDPEFALPIIGHWIVYEWVSELLGLLGTLSIIVLIIYRQVKNPSRLGRRSRFFGSTKWQAYFVEAMVLLESVAILFIRGAEYKLLDHAEKSHFPISWMFGEALYPDSHAALENIIFFVAMVKIVSAMAWLIVISNNLTMGIAWHRFTAWFNIFFKRKSDGGTALGALKPLTSGGKPVTLDDIDDLDENATLGVGKVEDFSWKGLLDFTTCTECGRCQSQCPAWNTEKPLSPKLLMMGLRDNAHARAPFVQAGGEDSEAAVALLEADPALAAVAERSLIGSRADDEQWFYNPEGGDFVIDEDVLWSCTSCGACVQQCPVDIEHVDHIVDMRRYQVLVEANFPAELNQLFKGLENKGNPWNMSPSARLDWAKGMDPQPQVVGEDIDSLEEVEWLFWVGCAGAYEDRAKKTTRAVAELLQIAEVSYGVLGNGETCTGDPARRAGNEFVFQGLAQQNAEVLTEAKAKKVVSTCAHCFNTLKNEYAAFGVELEVVHHTQLLNRLVREGKLTPVTDGAGATKRSITYHDPCYLGRHNQVYSPPRELLQVLPGAEVVEMERNSERSFCCGAGGARMWMEENIGERININRTKEAVDTGADQIAVGCPFCRVMLSDGLTAEQAAGNASEEVEVLDVAQMLLASVKGEVATRTKKAAPAKAAAAPAEAVAAPEAKAAAPAAPAAPASPAAPADAGSSLFDVGGDASTPDAAAPEAAAPAAGGGGSLFDVAPTEAPAAEAPVESGSLFDVAPTETPAAEAPAASGSLFDVAPTETVEAPTTSTPAASTPAANETSSEIPEGGSLFDIAAPDPVVESAVADDVAVEAPAAEAPPAPAAETPAAPAAPAAPAPTTEIPEGGSLFDITAPEPVVESASAVTEDVVQPAGEAAEPAEVPEDPETILDSGNEATSSETAENAAAVETEEAPKPASGPAGQPRTDVDINETGSLFDL